MAGIGNGSRSIGKVTGEPKACILSAPPPLAALNVLAATKSGMQVQKDAALLANTLQRPT
ncbi:MAG: hypothetical protein CBE00_01605 [Planctomycetaceae bacterium TMED240]|nr:hypothetical protein [Rhodopirellula sp.]OUX08522.1 MAG: hypothetical protein CBE00_01605 [Planctomycetaceae bacterium TMED240]